jgi:hypothetical protein
MEELYFVLLQLFRNRQISVRSIDVVVRVPKVGWVHTRFLALQVG